MELLGEGRVVDLFTVHGRGTAVIVDIIDGVWRPGSQLVSAKGRYLIRSAEFIDGKNVPLTAIGLLVDNDRIKDSIVVGEEVWTTP